MKFLCLRCDSAMQFEERQVPVDGAMGVVYACPKCESEIAILANPMETEFVRGLGVQLDEVMPAVGPVAWSGDAVERLAQVPSFVRGMVKRIYTDYARERGISTITPAVMSQARSDLGLEGM